MKKTGAVLAIGINARILTMVVTGIIVLTSYGQIGFSLHPPGWLSSEANAIGPGSDGSLQAAGGGVLSDGTNTAVLWSSLLPSSATALNQSTAGSWGFAMSWGVVVGPSWNTTVHASAWNPTFIDLNPSFTAWSNAFDVAHPPAAGMAVVVGIARDPAGVFHALVWPSASPNSVIDLHPAGTTQSFAYGLDAGGGVAGMVVGSTGPQAIYWAHYNSPTSYTIIHPAGADASYALDIRGSMVGGFAVFGGVEHAYVWDVGSGTEIDLHPTGADPDRDSEVLGLSGSASLRASPVPVGFAHFGGAQHAVVWRCLDSSGYIDLHNFVPSAFTYSWARGAWEDTDGTLYISGAVGDANHSEAYIWVLRRGDVNGDGCIDDADLLAILLEYGQSGSCLPEDVNGDGAVDDADLLEVLFNFGNGC